MERPSLYERMTGWFERHRFATDATIAACLGLVVVTASATSPDYSANAGIFPLPGWYTTLWPFLMVVPLAWARTRPVASTAVMLGLTLAHMAFGLPLLLPADLVLPYSLYCLTAYGRPRWVPWAGIVTAAVGCILLMAELEVLTGGDEYGSVPAVGIFAFLFFLTAWALGLFRRSRRVVLEALRDRAERLRVERDQQAEIASAAERARIAREMHDVVAHSLSIVIAQADGGRYAAAHDPAAAERALGTIAETGRAALADMRRILGVLRAGPAPDGPGDGDGPGAAADPVPAGGEAGASAPPLLAPQPDVTQIEALVERSRAEGMHVSYARVGEERQLPPGIGLNIYRVAQEALTNVRKHAGPDPRVTVLVRWGERELELAVSDDGRGLASGAEPVAPGSGYGLIGMRERADLFGGSLSAGPKAGGGFRVRLVVPLPSGTDYLRLALADPAGPAAPADPPTREP